MQKLYVIKELYSGKYLGYNQDLHQAYGSESIVLAAHFSTEEEANNFIYTHGLSVPYKFEFQSNDWFYYQVICVHVYKK